MKLLKVDTVAEVKGKLEEHFGGMATEWELLPLGSVSGRYLAEDICAEVDMPEFRRSVVDGYAVIAKDTFGVSDSIPVFLNVIGAVEMGKTCDLLLRGGDTVYVPTGGMLPENADAMVMIEYTEKLDEKTIAVYKPGTPNAMIMNKGDDFKKGASLYRKGHRISAKDIGMLAALGKAKLKVFKKPVLTILSTGDEIVDIDQEPRPGQVRDINAYAIAAFAEEAGVEIGSIIRVPDVYEDLVTEVTKALKKSHMVLLSGGSSAGNKDMTAQVIQEIGSPGVVTHGISMKPGKPTIVGVITGETPSGETQPYLVAGLPGHPMAAIIAYHVVVEPFIKKYYFSHEAEGLKITARIAENIHAGEGRETYQLVSLKKESGQWIAEPIYAKSGAISQLMLADGYVKMEALSEGINANEMVEVVLMGQ